MLSKYWPRFHFKICTADQFDLKMAHEDPLRRVVGVGGDRVLETWCKNNVALCIITTATDEEPAICKHPMLQHFRKLGIVPQPLARPAVVSDKDAEWNLVLTEEFRMK